MRNFYEEKQALLDKIDNIKRNAELDIAKCEEDIAYLEQEEANALRVIPDSIEDMLAEVSNNARAELDRERRETESSHGNSRGKDISTVITFEITENEPDIYRQLKQAINAKGDTYNGFYEYVASLYGGDINKGKNRGYNAIYTLRECKNMRLQSFMMLCDYVGKKINLIPSVKRYLTTFNDSSQKSESEQ